MDATSPVDAITMSVEKYFTDSDQPLQSPDNHNLLLKNNFTLESPTNESGDRKHEELSPYGKMETVSLDVPDIGGQDFHIAPKKESGVNLENGTASSTSNLGVGTENTDFIGLELFADEIAVTHAEAQALKKEDTVLDNFQHSDATDSNFNADQPTETDKQEEANALSKYFSLPPDIPMFSDTSAQSFFDSLSLGVSPMLKSVSDVNVFPGSTESVISGQSTTVNSAITECVGKEVLLSVDENKDAEIEISEEAAEYHSLVTDSNLVQIKHTNPGTPDSNEQKPVVSQLFVEDKGGGDVKGKAFFDALAGLGQPPIEPVIPPPHETNLNASAQLNDHVLLSSVHPIASTLQQTENPFLLGCTELDRHYEPWIPCEETRQILVAMVTSPAGCYFPERDQLTMPGVIIEEEMVDPVKTLLEEISYEDSLQRNVLTVSSVPQNTVGLKQLMTAGCYHAAINLTTSLLTAVGQGQGKGGHPSQHTPYSLQLWFTRLALFVKLRKFSYAEVESEAFGDLDRPDLYYEFYPDVFQGKKGSMVSFSFRLLLAELPQYQGFHQAALDKLFCLLSVIHKILNHLYNGRAEDGSMIELSKESRQASLSLWEKRECLVLYSILNCVLSQKDYVMAVSIAEMLLEKDKAHTTELYAALGRIYLQLGDVKTAQQCFNKVTALQASIKEDVAVEVEELVNKALMAIAVNDCAEAYKFYQQAHNLQPANSMLVNNMAVCLLYIGKLKDALLLLEKSVQKNPSSCLHDGILFNTCTLYELESSQSAAKKQSMLKLVAKYTGDNFLTNCLKIPSNK